MSSITLNKKPIKTSNIVISIVLVLMLFTIYTFVVPSSQVLGEIVYKLSEDNALLLTFDDGPGPETPIIFEELKKENITAIFFVVCNHIQEDEKPLLKQMAQEGQEVALHGGNHHIFEKNSDIKKCKEEIEAITGQKIRYYRPPHGIKTLDNVKLAKELNLTILTWSIFPRDYNADSAETIILRVERHLKSGAIICMHDGPENRENTAEALPEIIAYARQKGYEFNAVE